MTLLKDNWAFLNLWVWLVVVLGVEFILFLFIGVLAAGCWLELRGGCFSSMLKSIRDI